MKNKKDNRQIKGIGSRVSVKIWNALRVQALKEGRKTGELLDDAIEMYLRSKKDDIFKLGLRYPFEQ
jgi:hypothetical protein